MAQSTRQSRPRKSAGKAKSTRRSATKSSAGRRRAKATQASPMKKATGAIERATRKVGGPMVAGGAAIAVAGGALLTRQLTRKRGGIDLKPVAKGISNAGERVAKTSQQLSKLSDDVEQVGKSTKKVGDSLS